MDREAIEAAELDGIDLGYFGEPDPAAVAEIDQAIHDFPVGHGWFACPSAVPGRDGWQAEIRRATPDGPDVVPLGSHPTLAAAYRACGDMVRRMLAVQESGDTALMTLMRASIRYAAEQRAAG